MEILFIIYRFIFSLRTLFLVFISIPLLLCSAITQAGYVTVVRTTQSCSWQVSNGSTYTLACTPVQSFEYVWVPDPAPPQSPQSVPPPPPPPVKTADQIEREALKKFCQEFPAKIGSAVAQCKGMARNYRNQFVGTKCSGVQTATWDFKLLLKDLINVGYSQTVTPGATCTTNADLALENTLRDCDASGDAYRAALAKQCSDVP